MLRFNKSTTEERFVALAPDRLQTSPATAHPECPVSILVAPNPFDKKIRRFPDFERGAIDMAFVVSLLLAVTWGHIGLMF